MEPTRDLSAYDRGSRRAVVRYAVLTAALFVPLLWSFVKVRNLYPFAASTIMMGVETQSGRDYYVLRGETVGGETIDLPPILLTDALSGRNWGLVAAAVENQSFNLRSLHPANVALVTAGGGVEKLPRAARLDDLLRAWGAIYNSRLPVPSPRRLKIVRLDAYRWAGKGYEDYDRFVESWRVVL